MECVMKKMIILSLCCLSLNSFADHHDEKDGKTFEEKKAMALEGIEKRISFINETKACVSSATNDAGLKACREKMKAQRKAWKDAKKQQRSEKKK
jgi:hypothetical protein